METSSPVEQDRGTLLDVAELSLVHFLKTKREIGIDPLVFPPPLQQHRATFVTLRRGEHLRGCMGTLIPRMPLVQDVAHNAYASACHDPRFSPLTADEFPGLHIQISLLTLPEPIEFNSEDELLARIHPGIDGLILTHGHRRGTLLPSVWNMCPDKREFMEHLKQKAGLPKDFWDDDIRIERYRSISWSRTVPETH
ncbi:MAG: AmmeMemoRadiSam system protein A [Planctomycetaceae bacterium]